MAMTANKLQKAEALWADGTSTKRIAAKCGVSVRCLMYYVSTNRDRFPARRKSARLTDQQKAEILRLKSQGVGTLATARQVGCCANTVRSIVKEFSHG